MTKRFTVDEMNRIAVLAAEGVPANWIAEEMDRTTPTVSEKIRHAGIPGHHEEVRQWYRVWTQIRNQPELLKLHREFAPH